MAEEAMSKYLPMDPSFPAWGKVIGEPLTVARVTLAGDDPQCMASVRVEYTQNHDVDLVLRWEAPDGRVLVIGRARQRMSAGRPDTLTCTTPAWPMQGGRVRADVERSGGTGMVYVFSDPPPALVVTA